MSTGSANSTVEMEPSILLSADDYHGLAVLLKSTLDRYPAAGGKLLLEELERADIVPTALIPSNVVMMDSFVEFRDDRTGKVRCVQLVYPYRSDLENGRLSVLSLVGAALIGLAVGESITWQTSISGERRITILRVSTEPFLNGAGVSTPAEASHTASPLPLR
jgi:regulator of nucleoside diphosphate kinase